MPFRTPARFVTGITPERPPERALWFAFRKRELLVSDTFAVPSAMSVTELGLQPIRTQFLGTLDGEPCFAVELPLEASAPAGAQFRDLLTLYGRLRDELFALAGRAIQIMDWDRTHQFCGACGADTESMSDRRSRRCVRCGHECFPRLAPAIIVGVERGDEILLARGPHFPPEVHSLLAGFVDPGESIEEAVAREVHEEVGLRVKNVRYVRSQPWPFPNSLMLGFSAEYESGEVRIDGHEIVSAAFYRFDALPKTFPGTLSISQWLLHDFLRRHGATPG